MANPIQGKLNLLDTSLNILVQVYFVPFLVVIMLANEVDRTIDDNDKLEVEAKELKEISTVNADIVNIKVELVEEVIEEKDAIYDENDTVRRELKAQTEISEGNEIFISTIASQGSDFRQSIGDDLYISVQPFLVNLTLKAHPKNLFFNNLVTFVILYFNFCLMFDGFYHLFGANSNKIHVASNQRL